MIPAALIGILFNAEIEALFKNNGVTPFNGHARLLQKNHVEVTNKKAERFVLIAKDVILATVFSLN